MIGSRFEFNNTRDYNFNLWDDSCSYTDDTICTLAIADAILTGECYKSKLLKWCGTYPHPMGAYGGRFAQWIHSEDPQPYNSFGNGSAMRVSPVAWAFDELEIVKEEAEKTALCTHNHPEGIKGAVATALAIFYAHQGKDKYFIRKNVLDEYYPDWSNKTYAEIKPDFRFNETCQLTIPPAIICFLESKDFVDCLKLAISLGGDADTLAAIAGPMAYAYYKFMPEELIANAKAKLPKWMLDLNDKFDKVCQ